MDDEYRRQQYEICLQRGHQASDKMLMSNPPKMQCKWCGVTYRTESRLIEGNVPERDRTGADNPNG